MRLSVWNMPSIKVIETGALPSHYLCHKAASVIHVCRRMGTLMFVPTTVPGVHLSPPTLPCTFVARPTCKSCDACTHDGQVRSIVFITWPQPIRGQVLFCLPLKSPSPGISLNLHSTQNRVKKVEVSIECTGEIFENVLLRGGGGTHIHSRSSALVVALEFHPRINTRNGQTWNEWEAWEETSDNSSVYLAYRFIKPYMFPLAYLYRYGNLIQIAISSSDLGKYTLNDYEK